MIERERGEARFADIATAVEVLQEAATAPVSADPT